MSASGSNLVRLTFDQGLEVYEGRSPAIANGSRSSVTRRIAEFSGRLEARYRESRSGSAGLRNAELVGPVSAVGPFW